MTRGQGLVCELHWYVLQSNAKAVADFSTQQWNEMSKPIFGPGKSTMHESILTTPKVQIVCCPLSNLLPAVKIEILTTALDDSFGFIQKKVMETQAPAGTRRLFFAAAYDGVRSKIFRFMTYSQTKAMLELKSREWRVSQIKGFPYYEPIPWNAYDTTILIAFR